MLLSKNILKQLSNSNLFDLIIFHKVSSTYTFFSKNEIKLIINVDENSNIQKITYGFDIYFENFEDFKQFKFFNLNEKDVFDFSTLDFEKIFFPISASVLKNIVDDYRISLAQVFTDFTKSFDNVFNGSKREDLDFISNWCTSSVESCDYTFANTNLNIDISKWDMSNCKSMSGMFENATFSGDISKWNTSNVLIMCEMFKNAKVKIDISKWDVSNVLSMCWMFEGSTFNGDISEWDVSSVENMQYMFVKSKFNGDILKWNLKKS